MSLEQMSSSSFSPYQGSGHCGRKTPSKSALITSIHDQHFVTELWGYDLYLKLGQATSPQ